MELSVARAGPYLRALQAGLHALSPHEDHVPLAAAQHHLAALDPALSGTLLLPAEVEERSGMPSFTWMERVVSEAAVAAGRTDTDDPTEAALERAADLDAALGARMRDRRNLHRHLRAHAVLESTGLSAALKRLGGGAAMVVSYDRMAPDGRWLRIRFELHTTRPGHQVGPLRVHKGQVQVDPALQHLLTRHFATPLTALQAQLQSVTDAVVVRLCRSWVGPFWFPGVALPSSVPSVLGTGLLLHTSTEVVAHDVSEARHLDPLFDPPHEKAPDGQGIFRERRMAASPLVMPAVQAWCRDRRMRPVVVPLGGSRPRRL